MAFISSSNTSSGKGEVPTASSQVSTVSTEVAAASLSYDTICAYIATQSSAGFDKSKVECFNYHKMGHFLQEQKIPKVEEPAPKALMALDGIGATWLMKMKTMHLKNIENLNNKINKLNEELSDCEIDLYNYKRGLSQVEARLVEGKVNETKLCKRIRVLERDVEIRDNKIESFKNELDELKKEIRKHSFSHKCSRIFNASKDLNDLLKSQKSAKDKTGVGFNEYTVVPPPPAQVYSPPQRDLSWTGETYGSNMSRPMIKFLNESSCPNAIKINNTENTRKPTVKYAEMNRDNFIEVKVGKPKGNWNNLKSPNS
ncbi:hypothetical protein Tco_0906515 [Tanacetum coccineum]|uniref:Uncharacterized protein n=1 Tax=Tanacetum coccineum TaxID=301880 RepID=A0ABQ5CH10_9ASTR